MTLTNFETSMNRYWSVNISVLRELTPEISEIQTDLNYTEAQNWEQSAQYQLRSSRDCKGLILSTRPQDIFVLKWRKLAHFRKTKYNILVKWNTTTFPSNCPEHCSSVTLPGAPFQMPKLNSACYLCTTL